MTSLRDQLSALSLQIPFRDFLSVENVTPEHVSSLCAAADLFYQHKTEKLDLLKGVSAALMFFESSTRTRSSFEWAGKQLGMDTINVGGGTNEKKGESLIDMAQTLDMMQPQFLVVRSSKSGLPFQMAQHTKAHVINAGDGWHEHPSQALLDVKTLLDTFDTLEGKVVTFVGDILHSRVFGSVARLFRTMGMTIRIAAPATLIPEKVKEVFGAEVFYDVEKALPGTDVIYILRVQSERGSTGDISTLREYSKAFGISEERLAMANENALILHPGPIQRDIDVHHALAALPQSRILAQIENGLAMRKAIYWVLAQGGEKKEREDFVRV